MTNSSTAAAHSAGVLAWSIVEFKQVSVCFSIHLHECFGHYEVINHASKSDSAQQMLLLALSNEF
jgi:hypothetical protein